MDPLATTEDAEMLWTVAAAVVMVIGLAGIIVPVIPGLVLILAVAVVYGLMVGFSTLGWIVLAVMGAIVAASFVKGLIIPKRTSEASGASGWAQLGALIGAVIGFFLIPVVGVIVGALAGVLGTEFLLKKDLSAAWTATKGMAKGFGFSVLIDLVLGLIMIATWSIWAWQVV